MTTLIIGGTGKTGLKLAHLLHDVGKSVLLASHSGTAPAPFKGIRFDWFDQTTFENPFAADAGIDRIYLVRPLVLDAFSHVMSFINLAVAKGVKLFVDLSASMVEPAGPFLGKVHQYLIDIGINYSILRPTWFAENFAGKFIASIRNNNEIYSTAQDGRIPFVTTSDIAQAAFNALTDDSESLHIDPYVVGPSLYSYDEVAKLLTEVLGRKITHKRLSEVEAVQIWTSFGVPEDYASVMVSAETKTSTGTEEAAFNSEKTIVGKHHLRDYFQENKDLWIVKN